ncbi:MAG: hypothetical protein FWC66_04250 [Oscillospiraceae bacterium]|nr:hypothetical protein [Oscillospiraceae bacterium]
MAQKEKKPTSWGWIIFWFIIFWPVGLVLLIKRLSVDKSAAIKNNKAISIVSYVLMGIGAIYLIMAIAGESGMWAAAIIFGGGGILVNRYARKAKLTGERYKNYIGLIVNHNQTSIDNIAAATNVPYDTVVKDLQKMITMGYFVGAHIDIAQREIVLARHEPMPHPTMPFSANQGQAQMQERVVVCSSCGANNRVVGFVGECEYCGSPLQ